MKKQVTMGKLTKLSVTFFDNNGMIFISAEGVIALLLRAGHKELAEDLINRYECFNKNIKDHKNKEDKSK